MATAPVSALPAVLHTLQRESRQALHAVTLEHTLVNFPLNTAPCDFVAFWTYTEHIPVPAFLTRAQAYSLSVLSLPPFPPYDYGLLVIPFVTEWHVWPVTQHGCVRRYDEIIPTASQRAQWLNTWQHLACQWAQVCQTFGA